MLTTSRLVPLVFHMLPHLLLSSVHSPICALVCLLSYLCFHLCAPAFLPRDAVFHLFLFTLFGVPCRCNLQALPIWLGKDQIHEEIVSKTEQGFSLVGVVVKTFSKRTLVFVSGSLDFLCWCVCVWMCYAYIIWLL